MILDFVDSVSASPVVRLPLVGDKPWRTLDGTDFGTAPLNRAFASTLLANGPKMTASAYDNRMLRLVLRVEDSDPDAFAAAVQRLGMELDRPSNFLRYQPDTSQPVFFRTLRSDFTSISPDPLERTVVASVLAEPFAYGLKQTSTTTVYADPAEGVTLNANPFFETSTPVVSDTFTRTVAGGWGTADTGQVWAITDGSAADFSVGAGTASMSHTAVNVTHIAALGVDLADVELYGEFSVPAIATGGSVVVNLLARHTDGDNHYRAEILFRPGGTIDPSLWVRVGGVSTSLASATNVTGYTAGGTVKVRFQVVGTTLRARAWTATEPTTWQVEATDSTFSSGGVGVRSTLSTANTNTLPLAVTVDTVAVAEMAAGPVLNANPFFETDASNWSATGGTVARSTAQAHLGAASLLFTPDGVTATTDARSENVPATVGLSYRGSVWARCAVSRNVSVNINWRDSGGGLLSTSSVSVAVTANTWTLLEITATAPASTTQAQLTASMGSTPPSSNTLHIDQAKIRRVTPPDWTPTGGTFVRSTTQAHEGVVSGLLTPDGVTATVNAKSGLVPATAGLPYRGSVWVRCAVARDVVLAVDFYTAGGVFISPLERTLAVAANTWTLIDTTGTAPATTGQAQLVIKEGSTPAASNTLHIDEARVRQAGGVGGMCFDMTGVLGDVETPLIISGALNDASWDRYIAFATRRRGTPANTPVILQAENANSFGPDTTTQPNTTSASGSGNNFTRTTFSTDATMIQRLGMTVWPTLASTDARGGYRVLVRARQSVGGDVIKLRLRYGPLPANVNDTVTMTGSGNWTWYDLGLIAVPRGADPVFDGFSGVELPAAGAQLEVVAQRSSGTGNLDLDVVAFIPADDQFGVLFVPKFTIGSAVFDGTSRQAYAVVNGAVASAESGVMSIPDGASAIHVSPGVTNRVWMVQGLAGTASNIAADITFSTNLTVSYWPRYLSVAAP